MRKGISMMVLCGALLSLGAHVSAHDALSLRRGLSPIEEVDIQEQRLGDKPLEMVGQMSYDSMLRQLYPSYYDVDKPYLYRIHPYAYFSPFSVTGPADYVKLQDGTVWYVKPSHRYIVKSWAQDHQLFIKPNVSCFSSYRYVLYNKTTNQVVEVDYIKAEEPIYYDTVHLIGSISIDDEYGILTLNDGTSFKVNPKDHFFADWWIGDRILIGVNNHWRNALYPHVLINASLKNTVYCEATAEFNY